MFQYKYKNIQVLSKTPVNEDGYTQVEFDDGPIYYRYESQDGLGLHLVESADFIDQEKETLVGVLSVVEGHSEVDQWIRDKRLYGWNTLKVDMPETIKKEGYKVHVLGLGDVGGMMLSGLRLLAGKTITEIGIYDLDENKCKRWAYELNQIKSIDRGPFPDVKILTADQVFDCDAFVFTASSQIPEVGSGVKDVRMYQLEKNTKIISIYAKQAVEKGFKGQFVVVSDPVDLLCKAVLSHGLKAEQIKGFGLGVMHARACYYGHELNMEYESKGRAFGPHGKHLIIANDIKEYDQEASLLLTDKTVNANMDVRAVGYKPFIAPALSSAALSILAYLQGKPHYSTVYIDGVYFGCLNTAVSLQCTSVEKYNLHPMLVTRLEETYKELKSFEF